MPEMPRGPEYGMRTVFRIESGRASTPNPTHPERNEDATVDMPETGTFAALDGVSGSPGSGLAAEITAEYIAESARQYGGIPSFETEEAALAFTKGMLVGAHTMILETQQDILTTGAVCQLYYDANGELRAAIAHAGDSRIYLMRDGALRSLTVDHSAHLEGLPAEEAFRNQDYYDEVTMPGQLHGTTYFLFMNRNRIYSALGAPDLYIDSSSFAVEVGDRILLCSDGVHDNHTRTAIQNILQANPNATRAAKALVDTAGEENVKKANLRTQAKDQDDISAVICDIQEGVPRQQNDPFTLVKAGFQTLRKLGRKA